jgi:hypothetical protein
LLVRLIEPRGNVKKRLSQKQQYAVGKVKQIMKMY